MRHGGFVNVWLSSWPARLPVSVALRVLPSRVRPRLVSGDRLMAGRS